MSGRASTDAIFTVVMGVGAFAGIAAFGMALSALWAFVALQLWDWFVVPLGAPAIGFAHAWGLMLLKGMLLYRQPAEDEKADWAQLITYPFVVWAFGAVAAWWMA